MADDQESDSDKGTERTAEVAQDAVNKAIAAFVLSPQAFAAKSQLAFGQKEAAGGQ